MVCEGGVLTQDRHIRVECVFEFLPEVLFALHCVAFRREGVLVLLEFGQSETDLSRDCQTHEQDSCEENSIECHNYIVSFVEFQPSVLSEVGGNGWVIGSDHPVEDLLADAQEDALCLGLYTGLPRDFLHKRNLSKVIAWEVFIHLFRDTVDGFYSD